MLEEAILESTVIKEKGAYAVLWYFIPWSAGEDNIEALGERTQVSRVTVPCQTTHDNSILLA